MRRTRRRPERNASIPPRRSAAIRFHARQPERYTAAILQEIQARLGVDVTGVADAATVQAIATFQQTEGTEFPELKVDGMADMDMTPKPKDQAAMPAMKTERRDAIATEPVTLPRSVRWPPAGPRDSLRFDAV